jgi:enoyl-[acyl-carrier protein] reductase I
MNGSDRLLAGKRGLILGVANDHSIAWGIATALHDAGAELALTYQGDAFGKRVRPLGESLGASLVMPCDVADESSLDAAFDAIAKAWGRLDFLVHAIAYSDKNELKGRYVDTTRGNFRRTMLISCYSFTELARRAMPMMPAGGSLLTLSFAGSRRVIPSYNVMGVAKAALEASVRYLAVDLGPRGVRVNAIAAGPMRTLAGAAIGDARRILNMHRRQSALGRDLQLDEVGAAGLYLISDLSQGVTGEILHVDCGHHAVGMPPLDERHSAPSTD